MSCINIVVGKAGLKGVYDSKPQQQNYLVTGSARLDVYKRGGDSLLGRYHYWRLHPLTLDELPNNISTEEAYQRLLHFGGFPEPFLANDEREARRWRRERFDRILKEDIRDLETIHDIQLLHLFIDAIRERTGQLVRLANLAQDLQISAEHRKTLAKFNRTNVFSICYLPTDKKYTSRNTKTTENIFL